MSTSSSFKKKRLIQISIAAISLAMIYIIFFGSSKGNQNPGAVLSTAVNKGLFNISVQTTGEIKAKNQKNIDAPGAEMQQAGYVCTLRDFWVTWYQLRRTTLFDFEKNSTLLHTEN
jgi:hypothetical protein